MFLFPEVDYSRTVIFMRANESFGDFFLRGGIRNNGKTGIRRPLVFLFPSDSHIECHKLTGLQTQQRIKANDFFCLVNAGKFNFYPLQTQFVLLFSLAYLQMYLFAGNVSVEYWEIGNSPLLTSYVTWSQGDTSLDWTGRESGQDEAFGGRRALGSPMIRTTNNDSATHVLYTPLNM